MGHLNDGKKDQIPHAGLLQSVTLGTSYMPSTSKNKSWLVQVPVHFNVY